MVVIASSTLLTQVVNELRVLWVTSDCICSNQYCSHPSAAAYSGQCCSFNVRKRARLSFKVEFHSVVKTSLRPMSRSCWLHALVRKVWQSWGKFLNWSGPPDSTRGRRRVLLCLQIGLVGPSHNQQTLTASVSCLPSCTAIRLFFFLSYRPGYYWNDGGVIDYLPMDSLFLIQSSIEALFCFPFAELELFIASLKMTKQSTGPW